MIIKQFVFNPFQVNTYIYYDEKELEGIIIDPGMSDESEERIINNFILRERIKIKYIINTHCHFDHVAGNSFSKEIFSAPIVINNNDLKILKYAPQAGRMYGFLIKPSPEPDLQFSKNCKLKLGVDEIELIHTPGHSPGGICIVCTSKKNVFCGDLIFKDSIGRTDLPGGDYDTLLNSISNILFKKCGDDFHLYPGHMDSTTVGREKKYNIFLKSLYN